MLVSELVELELDQHVALEDAVIEDQIDEEIAIANQQALLAGFETEAVTKFKQKLLEPVQ